jgi:hypothetical protein
MSARKNTGKSRKPNEPVSGGDRVFGAIGGGVVGAVASAVAIIVMFNDGFPFKGYLGVAVAGFPGLAVGGVLGAMFPRVFINVW